MLVEWQPLYNRRNYTRKSETALSNLIKIANESVHGTHLGMFSKMDFRVQINEKYRQLKNENKSEIFSASVDT